MTSAEATSRTPPSEVRRALRREVHFGCPVDGCGSPYLSWHHFDPPWNVRQHHDLDGMIALCLQHHKEADQGAFTPAQLRAMKRDPYLGRAGLPVQGRFHWKREELLLLIGGLWALNTPIILQVDGQDVVWLSRDEAGYEQLNLEICGPCGQTLLRMRDNDWVVSEALDDVECPPGGHSLRLVLNRIGISISLEFCQLSKKELHGRMVSIAEKAEAGVARYLKATCPELADSAPTKDVSSRVDSLYEFMSSRLTGEVVTMCTVLGRLVWPHVVVLAEGYTILPGDNLLVNCAVADCLVGARV